MRKLPASWRRKQRNLQQRNREGRIARAREQPGPLTKLRLAHWDPAFYLKDPVDFAREVMRFNPTPYQVELLKDEGKRIVVIYPRQSGKTTILAVRMIWYAAEHPGTTSLIVAPGMRQSMIVMDRIHSYLMKIPQPLRREILAKMQRTVIWFKNGAQIVALPNAPDQLRGYSASNVTCDESRFFREDELVFYSVLFPMLQTTQGTLIASSTPWGKDSVFYKFTQDPTFSKHRVRIGEVIKHETSD